jgi:ubiquinone biosynthesis protein COQ9
MAHPTYVPASLAELARLADEIWYLAGDASVDSSWYTKRASLSAVYASSEVFMTTDQSAGFVETKEFLERRLEDAQVAGEWAKNIGEWAGFTGHAFINVLRSKGIRI